MCSHIRVVLALAVGALLATACADRTAPNPIYADTPSFLATSCALGLSEGEVRAAISDLIDQVDALEASGALNAGQAGALRNHLRNALRALDDGNLCPAVAQLRAFRDQVASFVADGVLSEADGAPLLEEAGAVLGDETTTAGPQLAVGLLHTCGLKASGRAYCWGYNIGGELGDGSTTNSSVPVAVLGDVAFTVISAGGYHTCGLTADGTAYCWGLNNSGQLGTGSIANASSPVAVSGGLAFTAISAGGNHTCALTVEAATYCWGNNSAGQLGNGTTTDASIPVPVSGGLHFAGISARGGFHSCGLSTDGAAFCWGYNGSGQLGDGSLSDATNPVPVGGGLTFSSISAGYYWTCGVALGHAGYCWGLNDFGELGNGGAANATSPVLVNGDLALSAIDAGGAYHTCALTTFGAGYCWGLNIYGELGDGNTENTSSPVPVAGGITFSTIGAGAYFSCALSAADGAYCWGHNEHGELGDGTTTDASTPVAVQGWSSLP